MRSWIVLFALLSSVSLCRGDFTLIGLNFATATPGLKRGDPPCQYKDSTGACQVLGYTKNGAAVTFNLNTAQAQDTKLTKSIVVRVAAPTQTSQLVFAGYIGGVWKDFATTTIKPTGGWNCWVSVKTTTFTASIINAGATKIRITFKSTSTDYLVNLNYIKFYNTASPALEGQVGTGCPPGAIQGRSLVVQAEGCNRVTGNVSPGWTFTNVCKSPYPTTVKPPCTRCKAYCQNNGVPPPFFKDAKSKQDIKNNPYYCPGFDTKLCPTFKDPDNPWVNRDGSNAYSLCYLDPGAKATYTLPDLRPYNTICYRASSAYKRGYIAGQSKGQPNRVELYLANGAKVSTVVIPGTQQNNALAFTENDATNPSIPFFNCWETFCGALNKAAINSLYADGKARDVTLAFQGVDPPIDVYDLNYFVLTDKPTNNLGNVFQPPLCA